MVDSFPPATSSRTRNTKAIHPLTQTPRSYSSTQVFNCRYQLIKHNNLSLHRNTSLSLPFPRILKSYSIRKRVSAPFAAFSISSLFSLCSFRLSLPVVTTKVLIHSLAHSVTVLYRPVRPEYPNTWALFSVCFYSDPSVGLQL